VITGILNLLINTLAISNLIGSRCYVNKAPQKAALPYIVLTQLNSEEFLSLDATTSTLRSIVIDVDCKGRTFPETESLANAVKTRLTDYSGAAGGFTVGATIFNSESHDYEPATDGSDNGVFAITLDYDIIFNP
jgi:hypothetical protein